MSIHQAPPAFVNTVRIDVFFKMRTLSVVKSFSAARCIDNWTRLSKDWEIGLGDTGVCVGYIYLQDKLNARYFKQCLSEQQFC